MRVLVGAEGDLGRGVARPVVTVPPSKPERVLCFCSLEAPCLPQRSR